MAKQTKVTNQMNGALAAALRAAMGNGASRVQLDLPEKISTPFGEHEVWYAWDDEGLYACISTTGLFPFLLVSGTDLSSSEGIGWRVDLPTKEIERLYTLGREVSDLGKKNPKPLAKAENW
jgi:hypothetical protein